MADPKGDKLYVNLGASQARRRLKGFGHGVRKVQTAGRNQAVIIHTATGRHLAELQAKFADVGCSIPSSSISGFTSNGAIDCDLQHCDLEDSVLEDSEHYADDVGESRRL